MHISQDWQVGVELARCWSWNLKLTPTRNLLLSLVSFMAAVDVQRLPAHCGGCGAEQGVLVSRCTKKVSLAAFGNCWVTLSINPPGLLICALCEQIASVHSLFKIWRVEPRVGIVTKAGNRIDKHSCSYSHSACVEIYIFPYIPNGLL